jgi:hypothetical protein
VHRDVSPQNVLIGHTGHIKLIDFGIAKSQLMSYQASRGSSVLGKLRYMAPEQLQLQPVSRRTDVYALGVMLWEMLTARNLLRCFRFDDERDWTTREDPPPPSRHASSVAKAIDQAVLKAIACAPEGRYENALSFRRAMLRAEPTASQVDAPAFATLIHHLLGDELERRRADFPSEVNVQLKSDVVSDTEPALKLEELTARIRPAEGSDPVCADEPDEPTQQAPSPFLRGEFNDDETVVRLPQRSVQAQVATVGARPSLARPPAPLMHKLKQLSQHKAVDTVALALFVALAAYAAGSLPRLYPSLVGSKAAAGYVRRGPSALEHAPDTVQTAPAAHDDPAPLKLHETQIVSTAPEAPKPSAARANAVPVQRRKPGSGRIPVLSAKKLEARQRGPKLGRR